MLQFHGAPPSVLSCVASRKNTTLAIPEPVSSQLLELLNEPEIVAFAAGARKLTPVGPVGAGGTGTATTFWTFIDCVALAESPAASNATARSVWVPLTSLVVSRLPPYGAEASERTSAPSSENSTRATPTSSVAFAA